MRIVKFTLKGLLALLLLSLVAGGIYAWRSFPTLDGDIRAPGLTAPVQVRRDGSDVTHIEAQSQADASFAIGYVHAQERSWQLEFNRRVMHGELSEVFGPRTLETDRLMRRLGIMRAAQAQWERLPAESQALLQAYARGINAYHASSAQALPPEFHVLGVKPGEWTAQDSVAWALMMALDLGGNWGAEFARLSALQRLSTQQLWQLMPAYPGEAPATGTDLAALYRGLNVYKPEGPAPQKTVAIDPLHDEWLQGIGQAEGVGSNNWVVAGSHTQSGKPLVANDPHLGLSSPAIWYFARLKAPAAPGGKALDVIGATLPGLPMVVLGRTAGVAWGFTNTSPDVQDLYLEQVNPANPKQYRTPEGWADFVAHEETIKVKGQPDEKFTVLATRHGPVLSNEHPTYSQVLDTSRYALALRWAALDADNQTLLAGYRANLAQNVDELLAAFSLHHSPMQSLVAADTSGKTAFQAIGRSPLRRADNDLRGVAPAPGWDPKYDWSGWIGPGQTPQVDHAAIEAKGWHATANQRIPPKDFPHYMGQDWVTPERYNRIETLLAATPKHDAASMREVQSDTFSSATARLLPVLQATKSEHPQAAAALALLKDFDGTMKQDSGAPLLFAVWADELTRGLIEPQLGAARFKALYGKRTYRAGLETMLLDANAQAFWCGAGGCAEASSKALARALDRIAAQQGSDSGAWRWGKAHPAISGHRPFSNVAALAKFFDVQVPTGGDPWTVNVGQYWANEPAMPFATRHAASLRAIYDLADPEKSQFVYQTGQSGLVFSPRYRDMAQEWAQVRYRPLQMQPQGWAHQATLVP
ncbi:penicillin acylase family protein [Ramlibacter solisilvae]|uniref:Penicillin amidase n=1 Tax=Ramlibacter tataouinensis TaxID=94132 RepID=A0A127JQM0_9BURK|nr:penicillin acylase family protein [Ramlibacter tataouinensis]AMO22334.1 penicillin amidase [Ramlibacter tataouinensis]